LAAEFEGGRKARENTEKHRCGKALFMLCRILFCTNRDIEKEASSFFLLLKTAFHGIDITMP
jgi:hypothetical protein